MFGFLWKKRKKGGASRQEERFSALNRMLEERFEALEAGLRDALRRERQNKATLDEVLEGQRATLDILRREHRGSPSFEALVSFAENFALAGLSTPATPASLILSRKLDALLECFGLALIATIAVPFDPERHEACATRYDPSMPEGVVLEIVRPGFLEGERVMQFATVVVNRMRDGEPERQS